MLNKNGWGFRTFIIMGAVLLIALLITTFFVIRLYSQLPSLTDINLDSQNYSDIEENIQYAALDYYKDFYNSEKITGVLVLSTDNLIKHELLERKDLIDTSNDDLCKGYAIVKENENKKIVAEGYIKCSEYITEGYQDWRVNNE